MNTPPPCGHCDFCVCVEDDMSEWCIGCGDRLIDAIDSDPNGEKNATCARCRAEEAHDYDAEPLVIFNRWGERT